MKTMPNPLRHKLQGNGNKTDGATGSGLMFWDKGQSLPNSSWSIID